MVNLSKSKYCALWQCPKMLWLRKYKPELAEVDSHTLSIMETGNAVSQVYWGIKGRRGVTDGHTSSCCLHIRAGSITSGSQPPTLPPAKQGPSVFRGNAVVTAAAFPRSGCRESAL